MKTRKKKIKEKVQKIDFLKKEKKNADRKRRGKHYPQKETRHKNLRVHLPHKTLLQGCYMSTMWIRAMKKPPRIQTSELRSLVPEQVPCCCPAMISAPFREQGKPEGSKNRPLANQD